MLLQEDSFSYFLQEDATSLIKLEDDSIGDKYLQEDSGYIFQENGSFLLFEYDETPYNYLQEDDTFYFLEDGISFLQLES